MAKTKVVFFCKECGYESPKWLGKCPGCEAWNSFCEEKIVDKKETVGGVQLQRSELKKLKDIESKDKARFDTGYEELNRVLGGGIVDGSLILLGGEPGIGKSTLILQICDKLASNMKVLYVSGEESELQVKLRADRLKIDKEDIYFLSETNIQIIEDKIMSNSPKVCIIDSIQTMYDEEISSVPGSVSQVREVTARLMNISKKLGIITIVIGHVTKDGNIAGPRLLEHMVDVVLYIEGERFFSHRVIRGVKNRFGSTNEIGVFEMKQEGMCEVKNMSEMFLSKEEAEPGVATCAIQEGTSTILLEIQALSATSYYNMPRRVATGVDFNRLNMILAVIEKVCNIQIGNKDIYVNVTGGMRLTDISSDLAVAMSIISSYKGVALAKDVVYIGELSLTGDIRPVINIEKRIKELIKLGFKKVYGPKSQLETLEKQYNEIEIVKVKNINELISK
ncbi:MAG: DNA repair protein RadA [Clostridia bacterium]|nr:DNA repair protein RadA [Clostridia bacterium]